MRRFANRFAAATALALTGFAGPALATDLSQMTEDERAAFRAEVRSYLLDNPEVIIEAVQLLEQRQQQAQVQADFDLVAEHKDALFNDGYSWVGGNPEGDITIVEFLDYRCGYCRRAMPEVARLMAEDGNIRLIVKELPILGEASLISSRFAVATKQVAGDDAYKQMHDALMDFSGEPTDGALARIAEGLGLDAKPILEAMDSAAVSEEIGRTRQLAQALDISGTPTFVLQDELIRGFLPADQMAALIAEKRDN